MKNLFKRKKKETSYHECFTGRVQFILGSEIKSGRIFGKPYNAEKILFNPGGMTYHILDDQGKVHDIKHHAIEREKI